MVFFRVLPHPMPGFCAIFHRRFFFSFLKEKIITTNWPGLYSSIHLCEILTAKKQPVTPSTCNEKPTICWSHLAPNIYIYVPLLRNKLPYFHSKRERFEFPAFPWRESEVLRKCEKIFVERGFRRRTMATVAVPQAQSIHAQKKNRIQVSNTKKPLFFYVNLAKVKSPSLILFCSMMICSCSVILIWFVSNVNYGFNFSFFIFFDDCAFMNSVERLLDWFLLKKKIWWSVTELSVRKERICQILFFMQSFIFWILFLRKIEKNLRNCSKWRNF